VPGCRASINGQHRATGRSAREAGLKISALTCNFFGREGGI
jgi:hypothetical protein